MENVKWPERWVRCGEDLLRSGHLALALPTACTVRRFHGLQPRNLSRHRFPMPDCENVLRIERTLLAYGQFPCRFRSEYGDTAILWWLSRRFSGPTSQWLRCNAPELRCWRSMAVGGRAFTHGDRCVGKQIHEVVQQTLEERNTTARLPRLICSRMPCESFICRK